MKTHGVIRFGAIAWIFCATLAGAMAVTFTQDTSISFSDLSYEGADIVITNCTLTVDGPHIFHSLTVQNGGVLTHSPNTNGPQQFTFSVANEPHLMSATNPTTLGNMNVDTTTITVLNTAHTTIYTEGVDYIVTPVGQGVQLTLTTNSSISEGALVVVNYTWTENIQGFTLFINDGATVQSGGAINVSGKGYAGGLGANPGVNTGGAGSSRSTNSPFAFTAGGGGAHGGAGGMSSTFARGGASYDSTTNPASLGSGGGAGSGTGGAGGGSATILVSGNFQIDGLILANGGKATNAHSGGGAGGTLVLSADMFSGAGTLAANGGGGDTPDGGGGGGGRIALFFGANNFTGHLTAFGGGGATAGGAGTIFQQADTDPVGQLFIVNAGKRGTNTFFSGPISDLTISGGAIAQPEFQPVNLPTLRITNLFVDSNSSLRSWDSAPFILQVNGDATVESNATITADFEAPTGIGTGTSLLSTCPAGAGASYGGVGGASVCGAQSGPVYGSVFDPLLMGSGTLGSRGGGAISMTVGGTLSLSGRISANGAGANTINSGSASGGGIRLVVGTLSGTGIISANGGSATNLVCGGGGGGRIAVFFNTNLFTGNITAYGGTGTNSGGPGSIYLKSSSDFIPQLIYDNGGIVGPTYLNSSLGIADLVITGGAIATNLGAPTLRSLFIGSNSFYVGNFQLTTTNMTIETGGGLIADGTSFSPYAVGGQNGGIDITGAGGGGGGGAGYGGAGITNASVIGFGGAPGIANSQYAAPATAGGLGGSGAGPGGPGGGVMNINIPGLLILNGRISANGLPGVGSNAGGGGGGSVQLLARTIRGAGTLSANGGNGSGRGGGGGGGAVALFTDTNLFAGGIAAYGGQAINSGGAGTVYVTTYNKSPAGSQLIVDNGGTRGAGTPLRFSGDLSDLTITGGAIVFSNTISTLPSMRNVFIGSNSTWIPSQTATINITSNLVILPGASLNVDGLSTFQSGGGGITLSSSGGGGGAAGPGGASASGAQGGQVINDSVTSPITEGGRGGGGLPQFQIGGGGGGALRISVGGNLRVEGRLSAEGGPGPNFSSGGGGGGSLWITTKALFGSGVISANGGSGTVGGGGGGGGGHISITYTGSNTFTGSFTARGGSGANFGGAGLIYLAASAPAALRSQLIVDNGGAVGGPTPLSQSIQGLNLTVTGGAILTNSISLPPLQSLSIGSNSTWLIVDNPLTIQSNATIQAGGSLFVPANVVNGPAPGQTLGTRGGGGGGHGGYGGASISNAFGGLVTSDSIISPSGLGSPGGNGTPSIGQINFGGGGGGVLQLTVIGTLQVDGQISANGGTAVSNLNSGGGSGGSIFIQVRTLSGAGSISANGGAANNLGGGGGGGRVAVWYNTNRFTGTVTARGGAGANAGGAGTVFLNPNMFNPFPSARLVFDNGGAHGTNSAILTSVSQVDVLITNGTTVSYGVQGGLAPGAIWNNLTITSNSVLNAASNFNTVRLTINSNVDIQAGGALTVDAQGSPANNGTGHGIMPSGGGGHGGLGSGGISSPLTGGLTYDAVNLPLVPGSGGASLASTTGSAGGGAIQLTINGALKVNGVLSANGGDATIGGAGGGSGGALSITAGGIFGNGRISANGGDGDLFTAGGGGGGRIALTFTSNLFTGTLSARGGAGVMLAGGAGTIYLKTNNNSTALVLIDNGGQSGASTPLAALNGLPAPAALALRHAAVGNAGASSLFANLLIDSDAQLLAPGASTITVNRDALVDTNGAIIGDATGSNPDLGPGSGAVDNYGDGGGGGYGGAGGASLFGAFGGQTHGSSNQPVDLGGAGGVSPSLAGYSQGGGAIRLAVGGTFTVNGIVSANGADGLIDGSGGGSGGSLWVSAPKFAGNGSLTVNGGMGEGFEGGGGGGGRIAIYSPTNLFSGNLLALGGDGANPGQDGTIYVPTSLLISGIVSDGNGTAIAGLTLQPTGLASVISDTNGSYSITVPPLWTGSVTPNGSGVIVPSIRNYSLLMSNPNAEDYAVTTPAAFNLTASQPSDTNTVNFNWYGLNGATYQLEASSNLVDWAGYGPLYFGSNAPISVVVPPDQSPGLFFRLHVVY